MLLIARTSPGNVPGRNRFVRDANGNCVREQHDVRRAEKGLSRPSYQDGIDQIGSQRGIPDAAFEGDPIHGASLY